MSLLALHILSVAYSHQDFFQLKPVVKKTYHYELLHPKLSNSAPRSITYYRNPVAKSRFPPSFLPPPKLPPHAPPLVPDNLNHLFQERPRVPKNLHRLFTPNTIHEPAVAVGQIENFQKDLEELAMEEEEERNNLADKFGKDDFDRSEPKWEVKVNGGLYNYNYTI